MTNELKKILFDNLIKSGCRYDNGVIYGVKGDPITKKMKGKNYIIISSRYNGKKYYLLGHQFIHYYMTGIIPYEVDHIDRNKVNNHHTNLRDVTDSVNSQNYIGKGYRKVGNRFESRIKVSGKSIYLGSFKTEEEARNAYLEAKKKYHPGCQI